MAVRRTRSTRQRTLVSEALAAHEEFLSAQALHRELMLRDERIGLATVYRNLQSLAEEGLADSVLTDSGEALYRRCTPVHHHHLRCRECRRAVEIEGPTIEQWVADTAAGAGYTDVTHTLELVGLCADCADSTRATTSTRATDSTSATGSAQREAPRETPEAPRG